MTSAAAPDHVLPDTVVFDFSDQPMEPMLDQCARDELWSEIQQRIAPGAAILEAGAGSGRWMKFLSDHGYQLRGSELSEADVMRFRQTYPQIPYDIADIRDLPYPDNSFDAVLSLGVFEHLIDGPGSASAEMARVLRPDGVVFLTVPHANFLFQIERALDKIKFRLFRSNVVRRLMRRKPAAYSRADEARRLNETVRRALPELPIKYQFNPAVGVSFYEYRYRQSEAMQLVTDAGMAVESVRLLYSHDRIHQVFGGLAVKTGADGIVLKPLGRLIDAVLPSSWSAHMILIIARKL